MAKKYGNLRLVMWIGVVFYFLWFVIFSLAPQSFLVKLAMMETEGFFLRLYGIFPLGWVVLFLFALKDVEKNVAIINSAIITGVFVIISVVAYHLLETTTGWFHWASVVVLIIYNLLLFILKPKATAQAAP